MNLIVPDITTLRRGVVYVAAPSTGLPEGNFPAVDEAVAKLRAQGYVVHSWTDNDREHGYDGSKIAPPEVQRKLFEWDFTKVMESTTVVVLPGWERSRGARAEVEVARLTGRYVVHEDFSPLTSLEIKRAREYALESGYLDKPDQTATGGVRL